MEEKHLKMNTKFFSILIFFSYFCSATIAEQSSIASSLFPDSKNSSTGSELYCLGGRNEIQEISFSVSKLNSTNNHWESITEMSTSRAFFGASVIEKKIYVCGGYNGDKRLNLLEVYDVENDTWAELAPMQDPRDSIGMTILNKHIYVSGGTDGSSEFSSVSKYFPETNIWTEVKPMNEKRYCHSLVTLHGAIYAVGGRNTKTVERYSPLIDEWTYVTPTNHTYEFSGATVHQNRIYVLGDEGFEMFDPKFDIWQELPSLNIGYGLQLVSMNDKLLAVGIGEGDNKRKVSKSVYEFNTINNSWRHLPDMDVPRKFHRAVVVNL